MKIVDKTVSKWAIRVKNTGYNETGTIHGITIDTILKQSGYNYIDILKLDVEGSEAEIFYEGVDEWLRKTKCIIIEFHDRFKEKCSKTFYKAIEKYSYHKLINGENDILIFDHNDQKSE